MAKQSRVCEKTILRNRRKIKGYIENSNPVCFISGTRYPSSKHIMVNPIKFYFKVLETIGRERYIDASYCLNQSEEFFNFVLQQLETDGLIILNKSKNPFGANKYSITLKGSKEIEERNEDRIKAILSIVLSLS